MAVLGYALGAAAISIGCGAAALPAPVEPFAGDWKLVPARSKVIDLMKVTHVGGDKYAFNFGGGGGEETIVADGTDQPGISGTTLAVTAEATDHWKVVRKNAGRVAITADWKLSSDGKTLHDDFTQLAPTGEVALHVNYVYHHTAEAPGFAGTWETSVAAGDLPSLIVQVRVYQATGLSFVVPSQDITRIVKFDGKDYPLSGHGAPEGVTSSARRVGARTLEVTDKSNGKIRKTEQIELSPDGKTLTRTAHPVGQQAPNVYVFERQS